MTFGRGFAQAFIDALAGEHVTAFPATIDGTLRLHLGDPGPDLDDHILAGAERRATLVVNDDLQGYVHVHGLLEWDIPSEIEGFHKAAFTWAPDTSTEARFVVTIRGGVVTGRDHLVLDEYIPWSVTSV